MAIVGFTAEEADFFITVVQAQMRAQEARWKEKKVKKVREKKPPKMKRAELLKRLLAFMEEALVNYNDGPETRLLLRELWRIVK